MKILCPACQAAIVGADVDLASGRAICRPCGELVLLPTAEALLAAPLPPPRRGIASDPLQRGAIDPLDPPPTALVQAAGRPVELALLEEALPRGVELASTAGTPIAGLTAVTAAATLALLLAVFASVLFTSVSLEVALVGAAALLLPGLPLVRLFRGGRRHYLRLDEEGLSHLPYRDGDEIHEPLDRIRQFVVDLQIDPAHLGELPALVTEWPIRMLTVDGRAVELRLGLRSEEQVRYVAARLNRELEALRAPLGYRG